MYLELALLALVLEIGFGYPDWLFARVGHPVMWVGALIDWMDDAWNRSGFGATRVRVMGVALLIVLLMVSLATGLAIEGMASWLFTPLLATTACALAASTLLAQRSLHTHVAAVAGALETEGLAGGRRAVAKIVGRDPQSLDEAGVSRAAVESLAENFSDGVVAPLFWLVCGGLPGIIAYKAVNTADSMIGHRTARHANFGWASARADDLLNLVPARLSALVIAITAGLLGHARFSVAASAALRDAPHHRSPNAGWPEAAMAGALGLRLAGPRHYGDEVVDDHWMGDGRAEASVRDIRLALAIYRNACALLTTLLALLLVLLRT